MVLSWGLCAAAVAQSQPVPTRGQMLYDTHCITCHTAQVHWRTHKQARDWDTLTAQVLRWQRVSNLGWSDSDIHEVAKHLNQTIYQFPVPAEVRRITQAR
jgi:mono/diheme cytochrome c family protein